MEISLSVEASKAYVFPFLFPSVFLLLYDPAFFACIQQSENMKTKSGFLSQPASKQQFLNFSKFKRSIANKFKHSILFPTIIFGPFNSHFGNFNFSVTLTLSSANASNFYQSEIFSFVNSLPNDKFLTHSRTMTPFDAPGK